MHSKPVDKYVYVTAKQTFLRDRVAAVSNRTGSVANGDKLTVLERARRFVKVKTAKGEVGWIDEKAVVSQEAYDQFFDIGKKHAKDPEVATATVRDEVYLHIAPGRDTDHFFRLAEGDKISLLARATLQKGLAPGVVAVKPAAAAAPVAAAPAAVSSKSDAKGVAKAAAKGAVAEAPAPVPVYEDWWLARDAKGETGWIYSRMIDVDAPEALARYAEGARFVGAYVLTHVNDPDSGQLRDGQPDPDIPVYVTVLSPYKAGLPYDYDQIRVFTWNLKKHRYETAFRQHDIEGYLPVTVHMVTDPYARAANASVPMPGVTFHVLAAGQPAPVADPATGIVTPGVMIDKTYRLEGNIMRRILPAGVPVPEEAHPEVSVEKKDAKKKHKK